MDHGLPLLRGVEVIEHNILTVGAWRSVGLLISRIEVKDLGGCIVFRNR